MYDHISQIYQHPTTLGIAFFFTNHLKFFFNIFQNGIRKAFDHPFAAARTEDEIIGKRGNILNVHQQDIFTLFVLQGVDNTAGKFDWFQNSPLQLNFESILSIQRKARQWRVNGACRFENTAEQDQMANGHAPQCAHRFLGNRFAQADKFSGGGFAIDPSQGQVR